MENQTHTPPLLTWEQMPEPPEKELRWITEPSAETLERCRKLNEMSKQRMTLVNVFCQWLQACVTARFYLELK